MRTQSAAPEGGTSGQRLIDGDGPDHNAGTLDSNPAAYRQRALLHAPRTQEEITQAVHDLAAAGYGDHGIADILQAEVNSVRRLLGARK